MTELEKMQRAKMYIDKLANGIDPLTGREMIDDYTLNQVRISRCLFYVSEILGKVIDNDGCIVKNEYKNLIPFTITEEQLTMVEVSEQPVGVSIIAKRIAEVLSDGVKNVPATHITGWLLQKGYLTENTYSNKKTKVSTPQGEILGIVTVDATNSTGVPYRKNLYNADAQRFVISHIVEIENEFIQGNET